MEEKQKSSIKLKHKCRATRQTNFLQQKRALPFFKVKNKSKSKNWKKKSEKLEENLDSDIVKDNFRHFFHLNLEDNHFDKELSNLEHLFTPTNFWLLIDDSYFQKNTLKERINNVIKEFSQNMNYSNDNILILQEDSDNSENDIYRNGYKYNKILNEPQETKIKNTFFEDIKSIIAYLKKNNKENDDTNTNINVNTNDNNITDNIINTSGTNNINSLEHDKELIKNLIKKFHENNDKKLKQLKTIVDKNILKNEENKLKKNNSEKNINNKCTNYIKVGPFFDQDSESLLVRNKFIDYNQKKQKIKFQNFEQNKKIFSFSQKFVNLKTNQPNKDINDNENIKNKNVDGTGDVEAMEGVEGNNNSLHEIEIFDNKKKYNIINENNIIINNINNNDINNDNDNDYENEITNNNYSIKSDNNNKDIKIINNNDSNINKNIITINNDNIKINSITNNNNINNNQNIITIDNNGINVNSINGDNNNTNNKIIINNLKISNNNINIENNHKNDNVINDNNIVNENKAKFKDNNENCSIEYKISYINNYLLNKDENNNFLNQGICCVCNNGDAEQNQFLLRCEHCNVTVHQNCYGVQKELYNWVCDACKKLTKEEVYNLECFLCPVRGGAFKKIELPIESTFYKNVMDYKHNKIKYLPKNNYNIIIPKKDYSEGKFAWAHLSCVLWNPNINLKNYEKKTGIYIENITYDDFNSYCYLCKKDNCGPTIKCNFDSCNIYYHPECARINNCCLEVEIINKEYQYNVYCYKHTPNLLAKKINYNCKNEMQQIINVNNELNNIYELYKKVYKNEFYQKAKVIKKIEIEDFSHYKKYQRHNTNRKYLIKKKFKKIKKYRNLENIVINLTKKSKRGRKKKYIINNYINNGGNKTSHNNSQNKSKKKSLNNIIINTSHQTIINNMGSGNNINIYVNNYNNMPNFNINNNTFPSPTIEINKKEFDKVANNNSDPNFDVDKYITDKNEFIVYLIGFLNDYTLNNRIIVKRYKSQKQYTLIKQNPIYFLKYDDFLNGYIPWEEIGYKNLTSSILRKSFFAIFYNETQYKKLFLDKIEKTLRELKKNKKFEEYKLECDNKEKCIGAPNGIYNLLSLDSFKYKILDEKHMFPKTFLCPSCINNTPNNTNILNNNTKKKNKKNSKDININIKN